VLTLHGEVVAIEPASRHVTVKDPKGETSTLEVRSEKDLEGLKAGDRVVVQYFEGATIGKKKPPEAAPLPSLKDGLVLGGPSGKKHAIVAPVEKVDVAHQEITLKGPDGSLETIMVANPEHLIHIKVGDDVVITHNKALALSLEKER
jgi:hypothetical protein